MFNTIKTAKFSRDDIGIALVLLLPLIFISSTQSLVRRWTETDAGTYTHGLPLALIAMVAIVWSYYKQKPFIQTKLTLSTWIFIIPLLLFWILATISSTEVIAQLSLLGLMFFTLCLFYGYSCISFLYSSFALLISVIPIWDIINTPLRFIGAVASSFLLSLTGFENIRQGFYIEIPVGIFFVDGGCSGLSQFIVALSVSIIYAWYVKLNLSGTIIAVIFAIIAAITANIIRIYIIIVAGQLSNMQHYFITKEHISLGWAVFALIIYIYFFICARFLETSSPQKDLSQPTSKSTSINYHWLLLPFIVYSSVAIYSHFIMNRAVVDDDVAIIQLPDNFQQVLRDNDMRPSVMGANKELHTTIEYRGKRIDLDIDFFYQQSQGREAINSQNKVSNENHYIEAIGKIADKYNIYAVFGQNQEKYIVLQSYWVNGRFYNSDFKAKFINSWQTLLGNPHIAYVVMGTLHENTAHLENFITTHSDAINETLNEHSKTVQTAL